MGFNGVFVRFCNVGGIRLVLGLVCGLVNEYWEFWYVEWLVLLSTVVRFIVC